MAMQTKVKQAWIEALESDKFKQNRLGWGGRDNPHGYCCLQVLRQEVLGYDLTPKYFSYDDDLNKAGLTGIQINECVVMNDCKMKTFPEIAQWVRENVAVA